jgi:hypothetical protein
MLNLTIAFRITGEEIISKAEQRMLRVSGCLTLKNRDAKINIVKDFKY